WRIRVTSVPEPGDTRGYIERALQAHAEGHRLAFAVIDANSGEVIGSSSYHDIVPAVERLEIGYTWYAKSRQRTHVNASAKLLLMRHAFETLGAKLVGWRTDNFNFASQRAIERLGARKDGGGGHPRGGRRALCPGPPRTPPGWPWPRPGTRAGRRRRGRRCRRSRGGRPSPPGPRPRSRRRR